METTPRQERLIDQLKTLPVYVIRNLIASERDQGRAFGGVAEAARHELARRGEQA